MCLQGGNVIREGVGIFILIVSVTEGKGWNLRLKGERHEYLTK